MKFARYEDEDNAKRADPLYAKYENMCLTYHRDRGEPLDIQTGPTLQSVWPSDDTWTEFTYVWNGERWLVTDPDEGTQTLVDLGDALTGKKTVAPSIKVFGAKIGRHKKHDPGPAKPDTGAATLYVAPVSYVAKRRRRRA